MQVILKLLPAPLIRFIGRLQFTVPVLKPIINCIGATTARKGIIQRGAGKGLRFDATGCNPGFLAGTSEPLEQSLVSKYSCPGSVVYDLGANAGFYAMIAARAVGQSGTVMAFEPSPRLCDRILANAKANGFDNVEVIQAAVTDFDGQIDFGMESDLSVSNSINLQNPKTTVLVKSVTLDTFATGNPPPSFILIDIEGAELRALQGGLRMLARYRPVVMVEVHWLGQEFLDFIAESIVPMSYKVTTYEGKELPAGNTRYHALFLPV